jgi:predicted dehydrogenase
MLVRNGRLGKILNVTCGLPGSGSIGPQPEMPIPDGFDYDLWLGPAPWAPYTERRCHWDFRWISDYSGGILTDWGAHHPDIAQWALNRDRSGPVEVSGHGVFPEDGLWNTAMSYRLEYLYDDGVRMIVTESAPNGVRFEGERGWVFVSRDGIDAGPKSLLKERFGPEEVHLYESGGHTQNFLDCVRSRRETVCPAETAHRSITLAHLGNIAMLLGRKLRWDPAREEILGDLQASAMLDRPLRAPWTL